MLLGLMKQVVDVHSVVFFVFKFTPVQGVVHWQVLLLLLLA
jgi:hypothetical protein